MLITTGKVQDGTIQLEGESLPEGAIVTVLTHEGDETFELNPEQEAELLAAIGVAERGTQSPRLNFLNRFSLHEPSPSGSHCYQCGAGYFGGCEIVGSESSKSS
jgi:hypothetical protein